MTEHVQYPTRARREEEEILRGIAADKRKINTEKAIMVGCLVTLAVLGFVWVGSWVVLGACISYACVLRG